MVRMELKYNHDHSHRAKGTNLKNFNFKKNCVYLFAHIHFLFGGYLNVYEYISQC